jgi:hypothetical protein
MCLSHGPVSTIPSNVFNPTLNEAFVMNDMTAKHSCTNIIAKCGLQIFHFTMSEEAAIATLSS